MIDTTTRLLKNSLLLTTTTVMVHHTWRKWHNKNAKISDYILGIEDKIEQIQQANASWIQSYQSYHCRNTNATADHQSTPQKPTHTDIKTHANNCKTTNKSCRHLSPMWISGVANMHSHSNKEILSIKQDEFSVVAIAADRSIVWQTKTSERVHDIIIQPLHLKNIKTTETTGVTTKNNYRHIAVMGRRPSELFWVMSSNTGEIIQRIEAENQRHFYGHACYSLDGTILYVSENNTETYQGIIGIYDVASGYKKIAEFTTQGIGPHEIIMHPDGDKLIIANGGIKTDRASREELNLDSMQPSLVYIAVTKNKLGQVLQKINPKHNQMSLRHISVVEAGEFYGTVAIGIQFQGEKHLDMPLLLTHKFGDSQFTEYQNQIKTHDISSTYKNSWRQYHHYIASVKVNRESNLICISSPIGGCVSIFDMHSKSLIGSIKISDCAGIAVADSVQIRQTNQEKQLTSTNHSDNRDNINEDLSSKSADFLVSDGQGGLTLISVITESITTDKAQVTQKKVRSFRKTIAAVAFDNHMQYFSKT